MDSILEYIAALAWKLRAFLGIFGLFMIERYLSVYWPSCARQLDRLLSDKTRRRIEIFIVVLGVLYAGYSLWQEEHDKRLNAESAVLTQHPIGNAQMAILIRALDEINPKPAVVPMARTDANEGAERYAYALRDGFHSSGIDVEMGYTIPDDSSEMGVILCLKDLSHEPMEALMLRTALKKAGIETLIRPFTRNGMHLPSRVGHEWEYVIWVASRPQ
jgi:hypothetical protein